MSPINPGSHFPADPHRRYGVVIADLDKTLMNGNSHFGLIGRGLLTRFSTISALPNKAGRIWETIKMTFRYNQGTLDPGDAATAVSEQLNGVPILPVAKSWANSDARSKLKKDVIAKTHQLAEGIVGAEMKALVESGQMSKPLTDRKWEEEVQSRLFVNSSQYEPVISHLMDVGPGHENLLGIPNTNIIGTTGTFSDAGIYIADGKMVYNLGEMKRTRADELFAQRAININPETTATLSDDVHYDRGMLSQASDPANRYIVDPDRRDMSYARSEGAHVIYDTPYLRLEGHWEGPRGQRVFVRDIEKSFFFDSDCVATSGDAWKRALTGAVEMLPLAAIAAHDTFVHHWPPATFVMPMAASMVYGPLQRFGSRSILADAVVGSILTGGIAALHAGHFQSAHLAGALLGGISLPLWNRIMNRALFERFAHKIGPDDFNTQVRFIATGLRSLTQSSLIFGAGALLRLLGLS